MTLRQLQKLAVLALVYAPEAVRVFKSAKKKVKATKKE